MRKIFLAIALVVCFCASCFGATVLNADDFMPVVRAENEEQRKELLTVQHPEEVKTEDDPVLQKPVTHAATAQDAINSVMQRFYDDEGEGCEPVALPGGGLGLVAVGTGSYGSDMKNIVAQRREQQMAYYIAFLQAKRAMAGFFTGASIEQLQVYSMRSSENDEGDSGVSRMSESLSDNIKTVTAAYLKGYVTYNVRDDVENGTIYVTIVSTPRTQGRYNRPMSSTQQAENLSDGINKIFAEIQSGVVPPVGGRIVDVPETGEIAFVGFGSEVVRPAENKRLRSSNRNLAKKRATLRAQASLCGIIMGDSINAEETDSTTGARNDENSIGDRKIDLKDPIDELTSASEKEEAEKNAKGFRSDGSYSQVIQSAIKGQLPPGVSPKVWLNDEGTFAYAVAVYVASVTQNAAQMYQDMQDSKIVQPYEVRKNSHINGASKGQGNKQTPVKGKIYKDSGVLQPGVSGTVNQPL